MVSFPKQPESLKCLATEELHKHFLDRWNLFVIRLEELTKMVKQRRAEIDALIEKNAKLKKEILRAKYKLDAMISMNSDSESGDADGDNYLGSNSKNN